MLGSLGGLTRFKDGQFHTYTTADGLCSNSILSVWEDREDTFWIGSHGGGISRLRQGVFTSYTVSAGLYDRSAFQFQEDSVGNLWVGCNRGIYSVSKKVLDDFAGKETRSITPAAA